jgi:cytochrome bd ubiquinol oxidase subunit II
VKDPNSLQVLWFGLIAFLWAGYLVLEGFDFGVGMLLPALGRNDTERRVLINTIGPVWDGNEVWLISAGGMMFAAFPVWYSTLLSAFYIPIVLILLALIIRGVAFEYRGKVNSPAWRARWDAAIVVGSLLPSLLWGVAFGNLIHGVDAKALFAKVAVTADGRHVDAAHSVLVGHPSVSVLIAALNPFSLLMGVTTVLLFATHGALYLSLKTAGELQARARAMALRLSVPLLGVGAVWAVWCQLAYGKAWMWLVVGVAAIGLVGITVMVRAGREAVAFLLSAAVTAGAVVMVFGAMYPNVLTVTLDGQDVSSMVDTTIAGASSSDGTLRVMTGVAVLMIPIVIIYQAWTYWAFRRRIATGDIPADAPPPGSLVTE